MYMEKDKLQKEITTMNNNTTKHTILGGYLEGFAKKEIEYLRDELEAVNMKAIHSLLSYIDTAVNYLDMEEALEIIRSVMNTIYKD